MREMVRRPSPMGHPLFILVKTFLWINATELDQTATNVFVARRLPSDKTAFTTIWWIHCSWTYLCELYQMEALRNIWFIDTLYFWFAPLLTAWRVFQRSPTGTCHVFKADTSSPRIDGLFKNRIELLWISSNISNQFSYSVFDRFKRIA